MLLRGFLSGRLYDAGLVCRADDRGDPVIQLSPPLVCGPEQFDEIERILREVLTEAWDYLAMLPHGHDGHVHIDSGAPSAARSSSGEPDLRRRY